MTRRFFVEKLPRPEEKRIPLSKSEFHHARRVLRLNEGALVEAIDGKGQAIQARLHFQEETAWLVFEKALPPIPGETVSATLALGVLKKEAMSWVIEKTCELGFQELQPLFTERSVVQTGRRTHSDLQQRWQRIADQALKQCGRRRRLEVHPPMALDRFLKGLAGERIFLCDENQPQAPFPQKIEGGNHPILFIGPEGGWTADERALFQGNIHLLGLGPLILRAETAAVSSMSLLAHLLR